MGPSLKAGKSPFGGAADVEVDARWVAGAAEKVALLRLSTGECGAVAGG